MISIYVDYPVPHFSIARDRSAESRRTQRKADQRVFCISLENISEYLQKFSYEQVRFASEAKFNDIWLEIDLGNYEYEIATLKYIQVQLGKRYKPLATAEWRYLV